MLAGKALTESITKRKSYDKLWRKEIGLNLWLNLKIRNTLLKFSDKDYNDLVRYFSQERLKDVLSQHVRDFPSKFILKTLTREPRLLKYIIKSIYKNNNL